VGTSNYDVVIIGAGSAGLTAGIYCARAGLKTLALEKLGVGGQLLKIDSIENYPGFPEGVTGFELLERMMKQAKKFGVEISNEEVSKIDTKNAAMFVISTSAGKEHNTSSVIVATGWKPKKLGIKGETELQGKGVSYCATCDGPLFKNKEVVVIGGGDTAVGEAIFLTRFAKKVTLIHRRDKLRATKILQDRFLSKKNAQVEWGSVAARIEGTDKVTGVMVKNVKSGKEKLIQAEGVFLFVGIDPNTAFLKDKLALDEKGFIITDEHMKTSIDGIYACGDVRRNILKQIVTACSDGAIAAYSCWHYIEGIKT